MFFLPPFGAVAITKEPWPTYKSELKIALAGPLLGMAAPLLFLVPMFLYHSPFWAAAAALASIINLLNLVAPIPILDGGRVIKSIFFSIHEKLGHAFYLLGYLVVCVLFVLRFLNVFISVLLLFLIWTEHTRLIRIGALIPVLQKLKNKNDAQKNHINAAPDSEMKIFAENVRLASLNDYGFSSDETLNDKIAELEKEIHKPKMTEAEMILGFLGYLAVIGAYVALWLYTANFAPLTQNILSYFK